MHRRHLSRWIALASVVTLVAACQAPPPAGTAPQPANHEVGQPAQPAAAAEPKAYAVQAKPFQRPTHIWRRGLRHPIAPPAPLPFKRLTRSLLATDGYAVTTHWRSPLLDDTLPWDVAFDRAGNAYVGNDLPDNNLGRIVKVTPSGQFSVFSPELATAVDTDRTGTKLAAIAQSYDLEDEPDWRRALATNLLYAFALPGATPTLSISRPNEDDLIPDTPVAIADLTLGQVYDVAYDNAGNILIADVDDNHNAIRAINTGTGMVSNAARFEPFGEEPIAISVGPDGTLYCIRDNRIWLVSPNGTPRVLAGTVEAGFTDGPAALAQFNWPQKIVYGGDGYLYVADQGNCAIRRVSLDGEVTTIAGNGAAGNSDGVGAAASFNFPLGLRYGPDGNLYVADSYNHSIRKIQLVADAAFRVSNPTKPEDTSGAFSPNGDNAKDTLNLHVTAAAPWKIVTLDAAGNELTVKEGQGNPEPQTLNWDGKVNGITLPDGNYTLRLKAGSDEKTAEIIIDTTPPSFTFTIDGQQFPDIIDNQLPKLEAKLQEDLSGFSKDSIISKLEFSRQDGTYVSIQNDKVIYDQASNAFSYKVPADESSVLYCGDQAVTLILQDRAGNRSPETRRPFAVGEHTLWTGMSFPSTAYRTLAVDELPDNKFLNKYKNPNYRITVLDPDRVYGQEIRRKEANPTQEPGEPLRIFPNVARGAGLFGLFLISSALSGDTVGYVYFDDEMRSIRELIRKGRYFRVDVGWVNGDDIGVVEADSETWRHINTQRKHKEIGPTVLATGLTWLKNYNRHAPDLELWKNPKPSVDKKGKPRPGVKSDRLLVIKYGGNIYQTILHNKSIANQYIRTAFGSGRHPGDTNWPSLQRQWFGVVTQVAKFNKRDSALWTVSEPNPQYPNWIIGNIADDLIKPYQVSGPKRRAIADPIRVIAP